MGGGPYAQVSGDAVQHVDRDTSAFHGVITDNAEIFSPHTFLRHDVPIVDTAINVMHWFQQDPLRVVVGIGIGIGAFHLYSIGKRALFRYRLHHQLDRFNADVTQRDAAEALLIESYLKFAGADEILLFAEQYAGPRNAFLSLVKERRDFLDLVSRQESTRDTVSNFLPVGALRNNWHTLRAQGWKVRFDEVSRVDRRKKTIFFTGTIAARDPRLTFFADLTKLSLLQRIEDQEEALYKTIEHRALTSKTFVSITRGHISRLIDYLVERDVYCLTLDYYRTQREEDPRIRMRHFEEILFDERGLAQMVEGFKALNADVDRRLVDLFDGISLDELLDETENHQ